MNKDSLLESDALLTPEYMDRLTGLASEIHINTSFAFLKAHNGLKKGKVHAMMGSSHSGKSTLVRSLILDALIHNPDKKVLLFLTEETTLDFVKEFALTGFRRENLADHFKIVSAMDEDTMFSIEDIGSLIKEFKPDLLFLDNITTASFYASSRPSEQTEVVHRLKHLIKEANIPLFLILHTGSEVVDNMNRLIEMNDVRGSKHIVNIAEFFYAAQSIHFQTYDSLTKKHRPAIFPTIHIKKHRGEHCEERLFSLVYDSKKRCYTSDQFLPFNDFKEMFKDRNKL